MKWVDYKKLRQAFLAVSAALALTTMALGTLAVTVQPIWAKSSPINRTTKPNQTHLPAALSFGQQGTITTTSEVTTPAAVIPSLPSGYLRPSDLLFSASEAPPLPDWVIALKQQGDISTQASNLTIVKSVTTAAAPLDGSTVFNGQTITYTITITNNTPNDAATGITLLDIPPENTQQSSVHCTGCSQVTHSVPIPGGFGSPATSLIYTDQITWSIPPMGPGQVSQTIVFSIDVNCKADGTLLKNQAFINYQQGGSPGSGISNETQTTVRLPPNSQAGLAGQPGWCADDVRNAFDLDWGDFDRDGDLDVALASTGGTIVYRNNGGQLTRLWSDPHPAFGIHWGNFDNDSYLELVSVGDGPFSGNAPHYVHKYNGSNGFVTTSFTGPDGHGFRVQPGNFDADPALELAISVDNGSPACGVRLYNNIGGPNFFSAATCLQPNFTSAGLAAGDLNNDGNLDLALNLFSGPQEIRVLTNSGAGLIISPFITIATNLASPYGMAWGNYSDDSYLDLAAISPSSGKVQVYQNQNGSSFTSLPTLDTQAGFSAFGVDWADFDGDGQLELLAADLPPKLYRYSSGSFSLFKPTPNTGETNLWQTRAGDFNGDSSQDVSSGGWSAPSQYFVNFTSFLKPLRSVEPSFKANSVAWGDSNGDGQLDLLFGAGLGEPDIGSRIYLNTNGIFSTPPVKLVGSGFGPHTAIFGDANGDGKLDVAIATPGQAQLFHNGNTGGIANWSNPISGFSLAWADADLSNNGGLDLLVGGQNLVNLYLNQGLQAATSTPIWQATNNAARSVAWGYLDGDSFPDFAVGNSGQPNQVYHNNGDKTFTPAWTALPAYNADTRSMAWGDYNNDGKMDLAVGNYGQPNYIYQNIGGTLGQTPVWTSTNPDGTPLIRHTTSLAWGDWNNDGQLDLAVGNYGEKDQVYANLGSQSDQINLVLLWESIETNHTTGIAWGDVDNDGDLDLAVSQDGGGSEKNGVYENTYVVASHVRSDFNRDMPLPQNPSYVSVFRPGSAAPAYFFSTAEVLAINKPLNPPTTTFIITIPFKIYDPDGTRNISVGNENKPGDKITKIDYEFSLDGGSKWQTATITSTNYDLTSHRLGRPDGLPYWSAGWDAGKDLNTPDKAVSDNVRFRITVVHQPPTGPAQRATTNGISPPFRVRNLSCVWPENPSISYASPITIGVPVQFLGGIGQGSDVITFTWDFGDNTPPVLGQVAQHTYATTNISYTVVLTVNGKPCPVSRPVVATATLGVEGGQLVYLPLILKPGAAATTVIPAPETSSGVSGPTPTPAIELVTLDITPGSPAQVSDLTGQIQPDGTVLQWGPSPSGGAVLGYHIYRASGDKMTFQLLTDVPSEVTSYTDSEATCGQVYFITAYNAQGESLPSTASYFSPPCQ